MIYELYLNKAVKTKTALHCYIPVEITARKQGYLARKKILILLLLFSTHISPLPPLIQTSPPRYYSECRAFFMRMIRLLSDTT